MAPADKPRVLTAQRSQLEMRSFDLDSTVAEEHPARAIWAVIERLELTRFYAEIKSRGASAGRPATDPKILLALWLYATTDGVGSARRIERLCGCHDVYRWICGGVPMNHHTISDFRVEHGDALDDLFVQVLAAMMHQGLVSLTRVAQDGLRVRADAGAASFRREATLLEHQREARAQVERLRRELDEDPAAHARVQQAARERAARERASAIDRALAEMPAVAEVKRRNRSKSKRNKKESEPRVSTTDPESRVMKMADGGFRPAYNVQLATDVDSRVIVGVQVTNIGNDHGQLVPMLDDIERRTRGRPGEYLVDGGFATLAAVTEAARRGATVYAPLMQPSRPRPPGARRGHPDTPEVRQWRSRMQRPDSRQIYKARAATAETTNADVRRWRTLDRFAVRGLAKAHCQVLLNALVYNLARWRAIAA